MYETRGEYYCEDAKKINPEEMPNLDLICAGFPCQSFSVAGKRFGFADTRGTLFFEVARIAEAKRPAFLLLENVPGLLSHDSGRTLDTIFSALVELGYNLEWCVLNSKYFGVPQQRRRLFIVGYRDGRCAGQIFPLDCGDAKNLKQLIPGPQGQRVYETDGIACTQCAGSGGWGGKTGLYFIDMNVEAGTNFEIKIGNAKTTAGSASLFSCVIYDFTDSKCLLQKNVLFGSNISFSVDCPSDADSNHDIRLLFYSGIAGYTKGIATEFSDIQISFFVDGINKGCGSAFSSPNELYTELSKRTTGDIKLIAKWKLYAKIAIVPIEPNAPYREKTNVISSFWLVNLSDDDYTPTTGAKVVFSVYNSSGQRIADETQSFVAPKNDKNLAYFGWYVPDGYASSAVTVKAYIDDGPYQYSHISESFTIASYNTCIEPDTDYNAKAPDGFTVPSSPSDSITSGRWWQWVYSGGAYSKKQFAVANTVNDLVLSPPTNPSAYTENGKLYMKSGYGFELSFKDSMYTVSGYTDGSVNECFAPQYYYALFPEYNYTYGRDKSRSIETVSGKKVFVNAADIARQHFTPIYYPDGEYKFKVVLSDCWTPAGMITTYKTVTVQINGNIYDDWYVGRQ